MFCFDLLVFGLKRNVLLCLRQFPDQIKLVCFVPEFWGQNKNDLLAVQCFMYQIKMFCFRSDCEQTKSKRFAFVPIISFDIETFVISFRYRWHYYCRYKRVLFCLGCSSRPCTKYFFPHPIHYFNSFVPNASKLGRQPCWVACLLVCVSRFYRSFYLKRRIRNSRFLNFARSK